MKIKKILAFLEQYAPSEYACDFDNVGLLVGDSEMECSGVFICLDVTTKVIERAKAAGANLIISHHPVIFNATKSVTADTEDGRRLLALIASGIAVYSGHTNIDRVGINPYLAELFGGQNCRHFTDDCIGMLCDIPRQTVADFAAKISQKLNDKALYIVGDRDRFVTSFAVISGGGADERTLNAAKAVTKLFISGDIKHHIMLSAVENDISMIGFGHYTSEIVFVDIVFDALTLAFGAELRLIKNDKDENPVSMP